MVSASPLSPCDNRCRPNRQPDRRVRAEHIQPARLTSRNGSSASHDTRTLLREVRPPQE